MWTIFKIINLLFLLVTTFIWFTSDLPLWLMMSILNGAMIICLSFLPVRFKLDLHTGIIIMIMTCLVLWNILINSVALGILALLSYSPVIYLISLEREYQADLLHFVTKWMAILLIPAIIIYWVTLIIPLPSFGTYLHPPYPPYTNYLFYLKTTFDFGTFVRFNAFFLEPGHLATPCVFIMMANRFDFKNVPWLWVLLTAVVFSFSLAGYLLTLIGFSILKVNSVAKAVTMIALLIGFIFAVQNFSGGENAVNQLILDRLQYDESKGIAGNNRFFNNTDYEFDKALKNGNYWEGVNGKTNMELIGGAGYKIYILQFGLIGVFIVLALYISLIPPKPNWHYTLSFLLLIIFCFVQNAYPGWYSWLLPYVLGVSLSSKGGKHDNDQFIYYQPNSDQSIRS